MITYRFNDYYIPDRMMDGIRRYIEQGIHPGHFLTAVIMNDLAEAVASFEAFEHVLIDAKAGRI